MDEFIMKVVFPMFLLLFALTIYYLYLFSRMMKVMAVDDYELYKKLGHPKLKITISSPLGSNNIDREDTSNPNWIFGFLLRKKYLESKSNDVIDKGEHLRKVIILWFVIFSIIFIGFSILGVILGAK